MNMWLLRWAEEWNKAFERQKLILILLLLLLKPAAQAEVGKTKLFIKLKKTQLRKAIKG